MNYDATVPTAIDDFHPDARKSECISFPLTVSFASGLFIRDLQFPFHVAIEIGAGDVTLRSRTQFKRKASPDWLLVPPGEAFDVLLLKQNARSASAVTIHLSAPEPATRARASTSFLCAAEVFARPGANWGASLMAERLDLTPAQLCHRLFVEGAALTEIVRKQRCMSALVTFLTTAGSVDFIAAKTGFKGRRQIESAFHDLLMFDLHLLERPCLGDDRLSSISGRSELPSRIFRIRS